MKMGWWTNDELKKALSERILYTELDEHLDDESVEGTDML